MNKFTKWNFVFRLRTQHHVFWSNKFSYAILHKKKKKNMEMRWIHNPACVYYFECTKIIKFGWNIFSNSRIIYHYENIIERFSKIEFRVKCAEFYKIFEIIFVSDDKKK